MLDDANLWDRYDASHSLHDRNELVLYYWPVIEKLAYDFWSKSRLLTVCDWRDLANSTLETLIDQIERFDRSKRIRFMAFARLRIRGAFSDYLRELDFAPRLERQKQKQTPNHHVREVKQLVIAGRDPDQRGIPDPTAKPEIDHQQIQFWKEVCRGLGKRERLIVLLHFRDQHTMLSIGEQLGVSQSRVSQMITHLLPRILARTSREELANLIERR
jgi:hypothetical protein